MICYKDGEQHIMLRQPSDEEVLAVLRREIPNWDNLTPDVQQQLFTRGIEASKQIHEQNLKICLARSPVMGSA